MPILRKIPHERDFVICDNTPIKDPALSAKAKGVLVVMLHLPDDWVFTEDGLTRFFSDGKASIRAALGELESAGYLEREHPQRKDGTFSPWVWTVREMPLCENRKVDEMWHNPRSQEHNPRSQPLCDLPLLENRKLQRKKEQSIRQSKDTLSGKPDPAPIVREVIDYLNMQTGKHFKASSKATARHIKARVAEGFALDDFKRVIDTKTAQWLNDSKMSAYLRPETLFGSKFEGYLNEAPAKAVKHGDYSQYDC